jgi:hypothetical protein
MSVNKVSCYNIWGFHSGDYEARRSIKQMIKYADLK